jgi:hypothetical protein
MHSAFLNFWLAARSCGTSVGAIHIVLDLRVCAVAILITARFKLRPLMCATLHRLSRVRSIINIVVIGSGNCSLQYTGRSYIGVHLVPDLGGGEHVAW